MSAQVQIVAFRMTTGRGRGESSLPYIPRGVGSRSIVAIAVMIYFYRQAAESSLLIRLALGMMLGGAISNLADRIRDGNVTDMIEFPHYPVFNVADSSVVIGIVIVGFVVLFQPKPAPDSGSAEEPASPTSEGTG